MQSLSSRDPNQVLAVAVTISVNNTEYIFQMGANNSALTENEDSEKVFANDVPISV